MRRCISTVIAALLGLAVLNPALAEEPARPAADETKSEVPALRDFHVAIYRIWHDAWPSKDTALLAQLLPDVESGSAAVAAAELPGILRDKKPAWEAEVKGLLARVGEYRAAVKAQDDAQLLAAAEALHASYERLVRTIRPPLRELDAFHTELYVLYHHHLPDYSLEKIRTSTAALQERLAALDAATLPERLKPKQPEFEAARSELDVAVTQLAKVVAAGDEKEIRAAIETMHSKYVAVTQVLE
jgi:hypothetical protein